MTQKSPKLPKRIAGVRVPKRMRRPGGKALALLRHPVVADVVAAGVIAAAAAMRDSPRVRRTVAGARTRAGSAAHSVASGAQSLGVMAAVRASEGADRVKQVYRGAVGRDADAQDDARA